MPATKRKLKQMETRGPVPGFDEHSPFEEIRRQNESTQNYIKHKNVPMSTLSHIKSHKLCKTSIDNSRNAVTAQDSLSDDDDDDYDDDDDDDDDYTSTADLNDRYDYIGAAYARNSIKNGSANTSPVNSRRQSLQHSPVYSRRQSAQNSPVYSRRQSKQNSPTELSEEEHTASSNVTSKRRISVVTGRRLSNRLISKQTLQMGSFLSGISPARCILKTKIGNTSIQVIRLHRQGGQVGLLILQKPFGARGFTAMGTIDPPGPGETLTGTVQGHLSKLAHTLVNTDYRAPDTERGLYTDVSSDAKQDIVTLSPSMADNSTAAAVLACLFPSILDPDTKLADLPINEYTKVLAKEEQLQFTAGEMHLKIIEIERRRFPKSNNVNSLKEELELSSSEMELNITQLNNKREDNFLVSELNLLQNKYRLTPTEMRMSLSSIENKRSENTEKSEPLHTVLDLTKSELNLTPGELIRKRFKEIPTLCKKCSKYKVSDCPRFEKKIGAPEIMDLLLIESSLMFTAREQDMPLIRVEEARNKDSKTKSIVHELKLSTSEKMLTLSQLNDKRLREASPNQKYPKAGMVFGVQDDIEREGNEGSFAIISARGTSVANVYEETTCAKAYSLIRVKEKQLTFAPSEKIDPLSNVDIVRSTHDSTIKSLEAQLKLSASERDLNFEQVKEKRSLKLEKAKMKIFQTEFGITPAAMSMTISEIDQKAFLDDPHSKSVVASLCVTRSEENMTPSQFIRKRIENDLRYAPIDLESFLDKVCQVNFLTTERAMTITQIEVSRMKQDPSNGSIMFELQISPSEENLNPPLLFDKRCKEYLQRQLKIMQSEFELDTDDLYVPVRQLDTARQNYKPDGNYLLQNTLNLKQSEIDFNLPKINEKYLKEDFNVALKDGIFAFDMDIWEYFEKQGELQFTPSEECLTISQIGEKRRIENLNDKSAMKELNLTVSEENLTLAKLNDKRIGEHLQSKLNSMRRNYNLTPADLVVLISDLDNKRRCKDKSCNRITDELHITPSESNLTLRQLNDKRFYDKYELKVKPNIRDFFSMQSMLKFTPEEKTMTIANVEEGRIKINPDTESLKSQLKLLPAEVHMNLTQLINKRCKGYLEEQVQTTRDNFGLSKDDMNLPLSKLDFKRQTYNPNCKLLKDQLNVGPSQLKCTISEIYKKELTDNFGVVFNDGVFTLPMDISDYLRKERELKLTASERGLALSIIEENRLKINPHSTSIASELQLTHSEKNMNISQVNDKRFKKHLHSQLRKTQRMFDLTSSILDLPISQLDKIRSVRDKNCKVISKELYVKPSEINLTLAQFNKKRFQEKYGLIKKPAMDISDFLLKLPTVSPDETSLTMAEHERYRRERDPVMQSFKAGLFLSSSEMDLNVAELVHKRCKEHLERHLETMKDELGLNKSDLKMRVSLLDDKRREYDANCKLIQNVLNIKPPDNKLTLPEINEKSFKEKYGVMSKDGMFAVPMDISEYLERKWGLQFTPSESGLTISNIDKNRLKKRPNSKSVLSKLQVTTAEKDMNLSQLDDTRFQEHLQFQLKMVQRKLDLTNFELYLPMTQLDNERRARDPTCKTIKDELHVRQSEMNLNLHKLHEKRLRDKYGTIENLMGISEFLDKISSLKFNPLEKSMTMAEVNESRHIEYPNCKTIKSDLKLCSSEMHLPLSQLTNKRCKEYTKKKINMIQCEFGLNRDDINMPVCELDIKRRNDNINCKLIKEHANLTISETELSFPEIIQKYLRYEFGVIFKEGGFDLPMDISEYIENEKNLKFTSEEMSLTMSDVDRNRSRSNSNSISVTKTLQLTPSETNLKLLQLNDKRFGEHLQVKLNRMRRDFKLTPSDLHIPLSQLDQRRLARDSTSSTLKNELRVRPSEINFTLLELNKKRFKDEYGLKLKPSVDLYYFLDKQEILNFMPHEEAMTMAEVDEDRLKRYPTGKAIKSVLQLSPSEMQLTLPRVDDKRCKEYIGRQMITMQHEFGLTQDDIISPVRELDSKRRKNSAHCKLIKEQLRLNASQVEFSLPDIYREKLRDDFGIRLKEGMFVVPMDVSEYLEKERVLKFTGSEKCSTMSDIERNRLHSNPKSKSVISELQLSPSELTLNLSQLNNKRFREQLHRTLKRMTRTFNLTTSELFLPISDLDTKRHQKDPADKSIVESLEIKPSELNLTLQELNKKRLQDDYGLKMKPTMDIALFLANLSSLNFTTSEKEMTIVEVEECRLKTDPSSKPLKTKLHLSLSEIHLTLPQLIDKRCREYLDKQVQTMTDRFGLSKDDIHLQVSELDRKRQTTIPNCKSVVDELELTHSEISLSLPEIHQKQLKEFGVVLRDGLYAVAMDISEYLVKRNELNLTPSEKSITLTNIEHNRLDKQPNSKSVIEQLLLTASEQNINILQLNDKRFKQHLRLELTKLRRKFDLTRSDMKIPISKLDERRREKDPSRRLIKNELRVSRSELILTLSELNEKRFQEKYSLKSNVNSIMGIHDFIVNESKLNLTSQEKEMTMCELEAKRRDNGRTADSVKSSLQLSYSELRLNISQLNNKRCKEYLERQLLKTQNTFGLNKEDLKVPVSSLDDKRTQTDSSCTQMKESLNLSPSQTNLTIQEINENDMKDDYGISFINGLFSLPDFHSCTPLFGFSFLCTCPATELPIDKPLPELQDLSEYISKEKELNFTHEERNLTMVQINQNRLAKFPLALPVLSLLNITPSEEGLNLSKLRDKRINKHQHYELDQIRRSFDLARADLNQTISSLDAKRRESNPSCKLIKDALRVRTSEAHLTLHQLNEKRIKDEFELNSNSFINNSDSISKQSTFNAQQEKTLMATEGELKSNHSTNNTVYDHKHKSISKSTPREETVSVPEYELNSKPSNSMREQSILKSTPQETPSMTQGELYSRPSTNHSDSISKQSIVKAASEEMAAAAAELESRPSPINSDSIHKQSILKTTSQEKTVSVAGGESESKRSTGNSDSICKQPSLKSTPQDETIPVTQVELNSRPSPNNSDSVHKQSILTSTPQEETVSVAQGELNSRHSPNNSDSLRKQSISKTTSQEKTVSAAGFESKHPKGNSDFVRKQSILKTKSQEKTVSMAGGELESKPSTGNSDSLRKQSILMTKSQEKTVPVAGGELESKPSTGNSDSVRKQSILKSTPQEETASTAKVELTSKPSVNNSDFIRKQSKPSTGNSDSLRKQSILKTKSQEKTVSVAGGELESKPSTGNSDSVRKQSIVMTKSQEKTVAGGELESKPSTGNSDSVRKQSILKSTPQEETASTAKVELTSKPSANNSDSIRKQSILKTKSQEKSQEKTVSVAGGELESEPSTGNSDSVRKQSIVMTKSQEKTVAGGELESKPSTGNSDSVRKQSILKSTPQEETASTAKVEVTSKPSANNSDSIRKQSILKTKSQEKTVSVVGGELKSKPSPNNSDPIRKQSILKYTPQEETISVAQCEMNSRLSPNNSDSLHKQSILKTSSQEKTVSVAGGELESKTSSKNSDSIRSQSILKSTPHEKTVSINGSELESKTAYRNSDSIHKQSILKSTPQEKTVSMAESELESKTPSNNSDSISKQSNLKSTPQEKTVSIAGSDLESKPSYNNSESIRKQSILKPTPQEKTVSVAEGELISRRSMNYSESIPKQSMVNSSRQERLVNMKEEESGAKLSRNNSDSFPQQSILKTPHEKTMTEVELNSKPSIHNSDSTLERSNVKSTSPIKTKRVSEVELESKPSINISDFISKQSMLNFTPQEMTMTMAEVGRERLRRKSSTKSIKSELQLTDSEMGLKLAPLNDKRCKEFLAMQLETMHREFCLDEVDAGSTHNGDIRSIHRSKVGLNKSDFDVLNIKPVRSEEVRNLPFSDQRFDERLQSNLKKLQTDFGLLPSDLYLPIEQLDAIRRGRDSKCPSVGAELQLRQRELKLSLVELIEKRLLDEYREQLSNCDGGILSDVPGRSIIIKHRSAESVKSSFQPSSSDIDFNLSPNHELCHQCLEGQLKCHKSEFGLSKKDLFLPVSKLDEKRLNLNPSCARIQEKLSLTPSEKKLTLPEINKKRLMEDYGLIFKHGMFAIPVDIAQYAATLKELGLHRMDKRSTMLQINRDRLAKNPNSKSITTELQLSPSEGKLSLSDLNEKRFKEHLLANLQRTQHEFGLLETDLRLPVSQLDAIRRGKDPNCKSIIHDMHLGIMEMNMTVPQLNEKTCFESYGTIFNFVS